MGGGASTKNEHSSGEQTIHLGNNNTRQKEERETESDMGQRSDHNSKEIKNKIAVGRKGACAK